MAMTMVPDNRCLGHVMLGATSADWVAPETAPKLPPHRVYSALCGDVISRMHGDEWGKGAIFDTGADAHVTNSLEGAVSVA